MIISILKIIINFRKIKKNIIVSYTEVIYLLSKKRNDKVLFYFKIN